MAASEQKLNKIFDQNVQITGDLTVDGDLVGYSGDNFYLDGITKSGNTLTFSVNGTTNQSYTFGSAAFANTTAFAAASHSHDYLPIGARYTGDASSINVSSYRLWDVSTSTDKPSGALDGLLLTGYWDSSSWATQQYHDFHSNTLFIRNKYSGTWQGWKTVIDSSSIGSQSVSYASNAGSIDGIDSSRIIYGNNTSGTNEGNYSNWDTLSKTGFYSHSGATGRWSSADNWSSVLHFRLYDNNNNFASQLGFNTYDNRIYARTNSAGTWTAWDEIITTGNKDSYTYPPSSHSHDYISEGGTSFSGEYPMVVRVGANNYYSHPNITFRGSDSTLTTGNLSVTGNTTLGNGNADVTRINDVLHVGASDSGNSSILFGEDTSSWYGAHLYWDSGYRFTWYTRNAGTDTALFYYDTNDLNYINWGRHHNLQNKSVNYVGQLHFNDNVRFTQEGNDSYLSLKSGDAGEGGLIFRKGDNAITGRVYWDGSGANFGLLTADGSWGLRTTNSLVESYHQHRAPIYYDSDNTGYYVNPASTSILNGLSVYNTVSLGNSSGDNISFQGHVKANNSYVATQDKIRQVDGENYFNINDDTTVDELIEQLGNVTGGSASYLSKVDDNTAPATGCFELNGPVYFDGGGDYIKVDPNSDYTWELWVKYISGSDSDGRVYLGTSMYNSSKSYFGNTQRYWGSAGTQFDSNSNNNGWYKITGTLSGIGSGTGNFISGTEYVKTVLLLNYNAGSNVIRVCGFRFYKSEKRLTELVMPRKDYISVVGTSSEAGHYEGKMSLFNNGSDVLRIQNGNGYTQIGPGNTSFSHFATDRGAYYFDKSIQIDSAIYDYDNTAYYVDPASEIRALKIECGYNHGVSNSIGCSDWFRSSGNTGWYNGTYSGGIYMQDSTWVRIYNDKKFYVANSSGDAIMTAGGVKSRYITDYDNTAFYADFAEGGNSIVISGCVKFGSTNAQSQSGFVGRHGSGGNLNTDAYPGALYSIGDSYKPSGSGLSNHYGVGYSHTNASFYGLSGQSGWGFYVSADGDARVQLNGSNGTISCTGDVVAYASDGRLKENVKPIENALDKVKAIRGVSYDWVENIKDEYEFHPTKMHEVGVIAQEVQAVLPEVVSIAPFDMLYSQKTGWKKIQKKMEANLGREVTKAEAKTEYEKLPIEEQKALQDKNDFLTVNYERIVPLLIEAIKEQQEQIEELKSLINKS